MDRRWLVFTDLDGTLLEERTYRFEAALPALDRLRSGGHILVLCTSKTFAECLDIQDQLGIRGPLIVENGGGIHLPVGVSEWEQVPLGVPYVQIRRTLEEVRGAQGWDLPGFGDLSVGELCSLCGLNEAAIGRSRQREFDEPFLLKGPPGLDSASLTEAFRKQGLQVTRGGRFFHLSGDTDKGRAVRILSERLTRALGPCETVGLGDSPNDVPMLKAVQHPWLVMRPDGQHDAEVLVAVPEVGRAPGIGPDGWNQTIQEILSLPAAG